MHSGYVHQRKYSHSDIPGVEVDKVWRTGVLAGAFVCYDYTVSVTGE